MTTHKQELERAHLVGCEFVRLFYKVMNSYSAYLYLFYERDSSVVICESQENDKPISMQACTEENVRQLLCWVYEDVSVTLLTCLPQNSLHGSLLLLTSGRIKRKTYNEERFFTQALLLTKQDKGYYVKTDTLHVFSHSSSLSFKLLPLPETVSQEKTEAETTTSVEALPKKHQPNDSCIERHMDLSSLEPQNKSPKASVSGPPTIKPRMIEKPSKTIIGKLDETPKKFPIAVSRQSQPIHPSGYGMDSLVSAVDAEQGDKKNPMPSSPHLTPLNRGEDNRDPDDRKNGFTETNNSGSVKMPELTSLFAARLPIGITPAAVTSVFSAVGKLRAENPVRVFTGLTNCYACVNFESESEMRKALESDVKLNGSDVVTEIWRPRDRRGRRIGRDVNPRLDTMRRLYCHF